MLAAAKKSIIVLGVLILMRPPLYAQNDFLLFQVPTLPEKESVGEPDIIPPLSAFPQLPIPKEDSSIKKTGPLLSAAKKGLIYMIDYEEFFFATGLRPFATQSRPAFHFVNFYEKSDHAFWDFIEKKVREDTIRRNEEKRIIREAWEEWLGVDIWYPYFKAKEIEDWICDRFRVRIFRFKGRMRFEKERITYTFRMQF